MRCVADDLNYKVVNFLLDNFKSAVKEGIQDIAAKVLGRNSEDLTFFSKKTF